MQVEKFVARVLDADHNLLAWTTVMAEAKPLGSGRSCQFWPLDKTQFAVEQAGISTLLTVHWCDADLARLMPLAPTALAVGQVFDFQWIGPVWMVQGMANVPLPPVTIRASVVASVPTGSLNAAPEV